MKQKNIYQKVLNYFKDHYQETEKQINDLSQRLSESEISSKDMQIGYGYGENNDWSASDNDQISMRKILEKKIQNFSDMREMVKKLEDVYINNSSFDMVSYGCIFMLEDSRKNKEYFLLAEGDSSIKIDEKEIWTCSRNSPMGKACNGKKAGDSLAINKAEYVIKEIL